ncbi:TonB-dependent hemoglobin/transferrin/lactoferrin family receptor [Methylotuvimicrobium buryatense]|nr:TonB-dependent hemoglobin/transferrin/lactoferrin family receptor [Methylotuvimicrobium buryatense]
MLNAFSFIRLCPAPLNCKYSKTACACFCVLLANAPAIADEKAAMKDTVELDTMIVEGTSSARPLDEEPGTASVIDAETIERRMVRSIKDLIRYEPGVNVGNDPQRFGATGFTIRGLGGNRVLMQVDGVRLPDAFSIGSFASATRNMVDMDALKSVEIIRGAGAAQYGGDALGGTVGFVTKDPRDYLDTFGNDYYADAKLGYNSTDRSFLKTATLAGESMGFESLLLLTHSESRETDTKGDNKELNPRRTAPSPQDNEVYNGLGKLLYRFDEDNVLRLTGEWMHSESELDAYHARDPLGIGFPPNTKIFSLITDDRQTRWRISLDHTLDRLGFAVFDSAFWRVYRQKTAATQETWQDRDNPLNKRHLIHRIFSFDNDDIGGEIRFDKHFSTGIFDHALQYGGQISMNTITQKRDGTITYISGRPPFIQPGTVSKTVAPDTFPVRDFPESIVTKAGAYLQDSITFLDRRVELIPGVRIELYSLKPQKDSLYDATSKVQPTELDEYKILPKLGALFHITDELTIHGQYAEGFRGPNFGESNAGFVNDQFGYQTIPNFNLTPETSTGFEIGLRGKGAAGTFDLTFFRNDYKNFLFLDTVCVPSAETGFCLAYGDTPRLTFQQINNPDDIRIQGVEFKSQLYLDWFHETLEGASLIASGSYAEGVNLETGSLNDVSLRGISPAKGVIGLRYEEPSGIWGSELILTLVDAKRPKTAPDDAQFLPRGYGVVDFNGYYRFNDHVSVNVGVFNLFDKTYIDWEDINTRAGDPHATFGAYANADFWKRYSRPGRNVGATLKIAF